jgi:hypothetical protein
LVTEVSEGQTCDQSDITNLTICYDPSFATYCDSNNICQKWQYAALGEPCDGSHGIACTANTCDPTTDPTCDPAPYECSSVSNKCEGLHFVAIGEACDQNARYCSGGAVCGPTGTCVQQADDGEPCDPSQSLNCLWPYSCQGNFCAIAINSCGN